jgi:hypothetical protein
MSNTEGDYCIPIKIKDLVDDKVQDLKEIIGGSLWT